MTQFYPGTRTGSKRKQPKAWSAREAINLIDSHQKVVSAMAAAEPFGLFELIEERARSLQNVQLYCANPTKLYPCFKSRELMGRLDIMPMFVTPAIKHHQDLNHVHYIPQHLSQWSRNLLNSGPVDVFWGSCSTPDPRGFVSLGVGMCFEKEILLRAKTVVLEMNAHMPVTSGASMVALDQIDVLIANDHPLPTNNERSFDDTDRGIAKLVASLVPDGATIQLGIGSIPNALTEALMEKSDLGVHTEMINDTIMKLAVAGVVTGRKKSKWPEKIIGAFAYGSSELYEFLSHNPYCELHHASIVNNPYRIGRNTLMTSINTAVEIDITGQVCSESIGHYELSGVGGATDTHVGAQLAEGGRGIIAMRSRTGRGNVNGNAKGKAKIVAELTPGAKISISRNDIDTVVTEYGIAHLKGRNVAERSRLLVSLAHPDDRDALLDDARRFGYL